MKRCYICGCEFEPMRKDQITCSDKDCRTAHYREQTLAWKKTNKERVNEYNREWIREKRAKQRAEKKARLERQNFEADDYAQRQIAKTLQMAGKVRTTLCG